MLQALVEIILGESLINAIIWPTIYLVRLRDKRIRDVAYATHEQPTKPIREQPTKPARGSGNCGCGSLRCLYCYPMTETPEFQNLSFPQQVKMVVKEVITEKKRTGYKGMQLMGLEDPTWGGKE